MAQRCTTSGGGDFKRRGLRLSWTSWAALAPVIAMGMLINHGAAQAADPALAPIASAKQGAPATAGSIGVGLMMGEPTALGARYGIDETMAVQGWIGGSMRNDGAHFGADGLITLPEMFYAGKLRFDIWFGAGLVVGTAAGPQGYHCHTDPWSYCHRFDDPPEFRLSIRAPVGISMMLPKIPMEVFLESAIGHEFTPNSGLYMDGGLGIRWYL